MAFSQITIPLANGESGVIQQIDFGIPHFGIIRDNREEVLKVVHLTQRIVALRIIDIDQQVV